MTGTIYICRMTLLTLETLILWISFANTTMRYVRLHKQSTLFREYSSKGSFKTFDYPSMPSTSMYKSAARRVVVFCWIWTTDLLSQVGYVFKLSRLYSADRPRQFTTAPSNHGGVYSVACTLAAEDLARSKLNLLKLFSKFQNSTPVETVSILYIILSTCPDPSHIHPKELSTRFVRHALLPPSGVSIGVSVYLATS